MKQDHETRLLEWYGGGDAQIEQLTDEDTYTLLGALGFTGESADVVVKDVSTILVLSEKPHTSTTFRNALFYGLTQLSKFGPLMAQKAAEGRGRRVALRESPDIEVAEHGTVCRARSERGMAGERPHIYIWFKPLPNAPCSEYAWYQFGQVNLLVDGQNETDEIRRFSFDTRGGAKMKMGEWRTDFVQQSLDQVNAARKAAGKPEMPEFTPPNLRRSPLTTKKPKGKAYIGPTIPGHRGDGVVDAPNLCYRGPNPTTRTASALDRAANRFVRKQKQRAASQPAAGTTTIAVVTNFRSYLVCIDPQVTCIGYVEWAYTTTATYQYSWIRADADILAGGKKWWRGKIGGRGDCTYTLTIGDFKPC